MIGKHQPNPEFKDRGWEFTQWSMNQGWCNEFEQLWTSEFVHIHTYIDIYIYTYLCMYTRPQGPYRVESIQGRFTYICHKNQPNVGIYTIQGSSWIPSDRYREIVVQVWWMPTPGTPMSLTVCVCFRRCVNENWNPPWPLTASWWSASGVVRAVMVWNISGMRWLKIVGWKMP